MKHEEFTAGTVTENADNNQPAMVSPIQASASMKKNNKSDNAFKTISEVADDLGVQQHVLRFWETKFAQLRPLKRGGGRRYYRPEDVALLKSIQHLLYTEGYTIKGVQKLLRSEGKKKVMQALPTPQNSNEPASSHAAPVSKAADHVAKLNQKQEQALRGMLEELRALRSYVATDD